MYLGTDFSDGTGKDKVYTKRSLLNAVVKV